MVSFADGPLGQLCGSGCLVCQDTGKQREAEPAPGSCASPSRSVILIPSELQPVGRTLHKGRCKPASVAQEPYLAVGPGSLGSAVLNRAKSNPLHSLN